tara:strand:- start:1096 stop:1218 length:123 start_codon:yes stop_codon:yes gene_type:complete
MIGEIIGYTVIGLFFALCLTGLILLVIDSEKAYDKKHNKK